MWHFYTPLKTSENLRFSDVFKAYRNVILDENGLTYFMSLLPFYTPWKKRKVKVFWSFQGVQTETSSMKWVKKNFPKLFPVIY